MGKRAISRIFNNRNYSNDRVSISINYVDYLISNSSISHGVGYLKVNGKVKF